ncbi:hypothetical protein BGX26_011346 [Mortierella sp. AD094]|nr:hypothetical protein BGX26_011346 [Mortierella sp. AD094]
MMERQYQRFRMADIVEEVCVRTSIASASNGSSSCYVTLEDIQDVFPNALRFKLNGHPIPFLTEPDGTRIRPPRIALYHDEILDVIVGTPQCNDQTPRDLLDKVLALQLEAKENGETIIGLQNQALDRLAILQQHAHAILVQSFELHEYPIPRLFIILPVDPNKWNPKNILENKFRLHFLCECGDHTMKTSERGQNQIHIARHEGYEIRNGTEFFCKYGKYMLILMRALKLGMHSVDKSAPLIPIRNPLDAGIDFSIKYMEAPSVNNPVLKSINTIDDYEALEGADLRQLGTFLQVNDENRKLGNLFRITIDTGHVKWVCIDHYHSTCQEKQQKAFADAVEVNGGKYDSQLGKVIIILKTRIRAGEFFDALTKARHVYDLDITFGWDCSRTDLVAFENALKMSNVSILRLDLQSDFRVLVNSLKANATLATLNLDNTIRKEEAIELSEALKTNTALITLNLGENSIGNEGALKLSEALKTNTTLTT